VTRLRASALVLLLALVAASPAHADELRLSEAADTRFPERSYALTLPRAMRLTDADVQVSENGRPVTDVHVSTAAGAEARRFGVVLAIDTSYSMRGAPLKAALHAARAFVRRRTPAQPVAVVAFDGQVHVIQGFTTDPGAIDHALSAVREGSAGSHMYDAAKRAAELIAAAKMPSASAVILSDGADRGSTSTLEDVAATATAAHARIYTVGLQSKWADYGILNVLAAETRGEFSAAGSLRDLARIYERLGSRLAHQYVVRYRSAQAADRRVQVAVRVAGATGVAAATYRSPAPARVVEAPFRRSPVEGLWLSGGAAVAVALIMAALLVLALWALLRPRIAPLRTRMAFYVGQSDLPAGDDAAKRTGFITGRVRLETSRSLERARWWPGFIEKLDIARVEVAPQKLIGVVAALTAVVFALLTLIAGTPLAGFVALVVPLVARTILERRVAGQRRKFIDQLPDNLQVMASAMRAGHSFSGALSVVVEDAPEPTRTELARVVADERMGVPVDTALATVVQRMQSKDLEQVALVATLQRETGGNTAEVLERLTETIRERLALRRLVMSLTAQGRMSRWVLTAIPVVLLLAITVLNPDYVSPLYHEPLGRLLLAVATVMVVCGSFVIGRIVDIKV